MHPGLLHYYERELRHIREMGAEFAAAFPKIAGRLGLEGLECADPYVERLIESFAFLAARVQLKIDAEFPRLTQHLLEVMYPGYLAPTPSMAVVQLVPSPKEGALVSGYRVPRDTVLRSRLGKQEATACEFRTRHDVTLWPIEVARLEYTNLLGELPSGLGTGGARPAAGLRLTLRTTAGVPWSALPVEALPVFFAGGDDVAARLHEVVCSACLGVLARPAGARRYQVLGGQSGVSQCGFADEDALLPAVPRSFQGYRLLHEYFAFPARFLFASLSGLQQAARTCGGDELEILIVLSRDEPELHGTIGGDRLLPYCTPAINLFPHHADRLHLSGTQHEYHLVPDRTRPMDLEVHSVTAVLGHGTRGSDAQTFAPLFANGEGGDRSHQRAHYSLERRPRKLSEVQARRGSRSSYVGSEVFLALVDINERPYRSDLRQLSVDTLCTNRDLPLHIPIGQSGSDFALQASAPVDVVRCVAGPSPPRASFVHGELAWRLVSHLSLNYLALADRDAERAAAGVRELMALYLDLAEPAMGTQVQGLTRMSTAAVVRGLSGGLQVSFARGMEVTLECDEQAFSGATPYILASVLRYFFARHVSINSFVETVLRTAQRGEIARWPGEAGQRRAL